MTFQPFEVIIGTNGVIPGFEKGLLGMKKGEKKTIMVPPELGYGT
jgi:FKBP-type peptidyl-prolyl cis-trans isomerase